jgi:hypothetical protein
MARAPGLSRAVWDLKEHSTETEVELLRLLPLRTLKGRIDVDGLPPSHEFELTRTDESSSAPLSPDWQLASKQLEQLVELGVARDKYTRIRSDRDGCFEFRNVDAAGYGFFLLPSSFQNPRGQDARTWGYGTRANDMTLAAVELPYLHGQFQWADTGEAVQGDMILTYRNMGRSLDTTESAALMHSGHFEIGLIEALNIG